MTKKILFVSTESTTAYLFILPYAKYLREHRYNVSFACSYESYPEAPSRIAELSSEGFDVYEIPFARTIQPVKDIRAFIVLVRLLISGKFDIVHTHNSKAGFIGRIAASFVGYPTILHTAHDLFFREYKAGMQKKFYLTLERIAAVFCDAILFVSRAVHEDAIQYRLKSADRLLLVGNGIEVKKMKGIQINKADILNSFGISPSDLRIGCVSRLVEHKGIDILIKSYAIVQKQYPNACLLIAGGGPLRDHLEALVNNLGVSEKVKFLGYLPRNEDIYRLISCFDVFALPTRREGLGIAFLEAMFLKCPVIGSRIHPVMEYVKEGETGLLADIDNPISFADAIITLLKDPGLRQRIGQAGSIYVEKEYNLDSVFSRQEYIYQETIKNTYEKRKL